jgi:hypothetical protein
MKNADKFDRGTRHLQSGRSDRGGDRYRNRGLFGAEDGKKNSVTNARTNNKGNFGTIQCNAAELGSKNAALLCIKQQASFLFDLPSQQKGRGMYS